MKKLLFFIFTISWCIGHTQSLVKKADKLYNQYAYVDAAQMYHDYIEDAAKVPTEVYLHAGDSYYFINNMQQAQQYYGKAYEQDSLSELYIIRYVRALRGIRSYEKSDEIYKKFLESTGDSIAVTNYEKQAKGFYILNNAEVPKYTIKDASINTENSDFGATRYKNKIVFSSSRRGASNELYDWNEQPFLSLFMADTTATGDLVNVEEFSKETSTNFHDATIAFSPDYKTAYFASSNTKKKGMFFNKNRKNTFKLFKMEFVDGKWTNKKQLSFDSDEYSVGQPAVSPDGKMLYFVSDMPGGFGEADIYYAKIFDDGTLSQPINAGPKINTSGNDFFPYVKDSTLYFSSNGKFGFGGLDIYRAKIVGENQYDHVANMGKPINSNHDDFGIVYNNDKISGYFSSNRLGGVGDDDIYYFEKFIPCFKYVTGKVTNEKTNNVISEVNISAFDNSGNLITSTSTNADGTYMLTFNCDTLSYRIEASKPKYTKDWKQISLASVNKNKILPNIDFKLTLLKDLIVQEDGVEKIKINPIFFDYDKFSIRPDAAKELDKIVSVMMEYPKMKIKIESHTDSRGSDSYNLVLSDKRAKATRDYIFSQGIAKDRIISAIGYGETQLKNGCSNGVDCTEEQHAVNRRSEFIITEQ
ncbi:OmpA family protein [Zhouia sp. PK063]|uniref:OmpA family protein n=1 Tax=Zhouia sp. PK063 TaxID=3373602 RepID=UPI0037A17270